MGKFNDFSALETLKKELEEKVPSCRDVAPRPQKRSRTVVHKMKAYTYIDKGRFALLDKPEPKILDPKDAIVKVTLASICTSDLHIKHGSVPRAVDYSPV